MFTAKRISEENELRDNDGYGVIGLSPITRPQTEVNNDGTYYNVTEFDSIQPIHHNGRDSNQCESIYEVMH